MAGAQKRTREDNHLDRSDFPPGPVHRDHDHLSPEKRTFVEAFLETIDPRGSFDADTSPAYFELDDQRSSGIESRSPPIPLTVDSLTNNLTAHAMSPPRADPVMSSSISCLHDGSPSKKVKTATKTVRGDDPNYVSELEDRCIATEDSTDQPINLDELVERLQTSRNLPTQDRLRRLYEVAEDAAVEDNIASLVVPVVLDLESVIVDKRCKVSINALWAGEHPLPSGRLETTRISPPKPDVTIGFSSKEFRSFYDAKTALNTIIFHPVISNPTLYFPCFTAEAKGLQSGQLARRQNLHNAAVMLRNLRQVHQHAGISSPEDGFDHRAHVVSATMDKGGITLSVHWTGVETNGKVWYYSRKIGTWSYADTKSFATGVQNLRNAIDWALEHNRESLAANLKVLAERAISSAGNTLRDTPNLSQAID
ncbi:hypothetical protein VTN02DRAFT_5437 [Thermoascus thermophilus]